MTLEKQEIEEDNNRVAYVGGHPPSLRQSSYPPGIHRIWSREGGFTHTPFPKRIEK